MKRLIALQAVTMVLVALTATTAAIPQESVTMVDCMTGDPCIGTSGNDTINGSDRQDVIYGLAGDDVVDPGADQAPDYVFCGSGFDTVDQMPRVIPDDLQNQQDGLQYASEPDVIAEDCEERAL